VIEYVIQHLKSAVVNADILIGDRIMFDLQVCFTEWDSSCGLLGYKQCLKKK